MTLVSVCVHFLNFLDTQTQKWTQSLTMSSLEDLFNILWGKEQKALASLCKKEVGREGSIESQQKFDFFSYDDTPKTYDLIWIKGLKFDMMLA